MLYETCRSDIIKAGDLVVIDHRSKYYAGLILEIESISDKSDAWCVRVTLKQPGFDNEFRIRDYDTRRIHRYEP